MQSVAWRALLPLASYEWLSLCPQFLPGLQPLPKSGTGQEGRLLARKQRLFSGCLEDMPRWFKLPIIQNTFLFGLCFPFGHRDNKVLFLTPLQNPANTMPYSDVSSPVSCSATEDSFFFLFRKIIQKTWWNIFKIFKTILIHYSDTNSKRDLKGKKKLTTFVAGKFHVRNTDIPFVKGSWALAHRYNRDFRKEGAVLASLAHLQCRALPISQSTSITSWMFTNLL